jgi:hypothetical protein
LLATEKWQIKTLRVMEMVYAERLAQVARYGHNEDVEDGTGPRVKWLAPCSDMTAKQVQKAFREDYLAREAKHGLPTWLQLVREELAEAAEAGDDEALVHELTQVAALCVSWIEKKVP